jgi:hypothetical protein
LLASQRWPSAHAVWQRLLAQQPALQQDRVASQKPPTGEQVPSGWHLPAMHLLPTQQPPGLLLQSAFEGRQQLLPTQACGDVHARVPPQRHWPSAPHPSA